METTHTTEFRGRVALRPHELARVLGVSRAFAYLLVRRGEIRSRRCGRAILIPLSAVDEFLAARPEVAGGAAA